MADFHYIYRIEDDFGEGPYSTAPNLWWDKEHCVDTGHPGYNNDQTLRTNLGNLIYISISKYHFAFKNIKQYINWFSKTERIKLFKLGYKLRKLKVSKYLNGDTQIMFKKKWIMK